MYYHAGTKAVFVMSLRHTEIEQLRAFAYLQTRHVCVRFVPESVEAQILMATAIPIVEK
jgi:hypothetical protein